MCEFSLSSIVMILFYKITLQRFNAFILASLRQIVQISFANIHKITELSLLLCE